MEVIRMIIDGGDNIKKVRKFVKMVHLPLLLDLMRWKLIDIYRLVKYGKKVHLFGVWLVVGLYGQGKTMFLTWYLDKIRKKYGDKVYIATNYYFKGEDFHIEHWRDLVKDYDKPIVFGYDEIQNDFNSRDYQDFPVELLTLLTQNRKGNGKRVIGTAQRYGRVDKVFRELSQYIIECHTIFGRLTSVRAYDNEDYEMFISTPDVKKRMKIRTRFRQMFVQSDDVREMYNSYQMLESARNKQYMTRQEQISLI